MGDGNMAFCDSDDDDDDTELHLVHGSESTGRWSNEEHDLFIRGLELYGKGWKKVANLIKTRTVVQIRTHSQK
jgi:SHAQKYF class myb-like DNA-binding protein